MDTIFLDIENNKIHIYNETGKQSWSFNKINSLKHLLGNSKVMYVTNAVVTTCDEIIELVRGIAPVIEPEQRFLVSSEKEKLSTEKTVYLTTKSKAQRCITLDKTPILFSRKNPMPLSRLYAEFGEDVFKKYPILTAEIDKGKLVFIDDEERLQDEISVVKKQTAIQSLRDKELDSIIVDNHKTALDREDDEGDDDHNDAIRIDVSASGFRGGRESNESSLLPDDV